VSIFDKLADLVGSVFPPAKAAKALIDLVKGETGNDLSGMEPEIQSLFLQRDMERDKYASELKQAEIEASRDVIIAEAKGESWIQRSWRPVAMLTLLGLIVWTVVPASVFNLTLQWDAIPDKAWGLLTVGIGGYIGARTVEKVVKLRKE